MANLLKNFELQKIIGATTPQILQEYFHNKHLLLEIKDFEQLKKDKKSKDYKSYLSEQIVILGEAAGYIISDFQKVFLLTRERQFKSLIQRIKYIKQYNYLLNEIENIQLEKECDKVFYFLKKEPKFIKELYLVFSLTSQTEIYWNRRHSGIEKRQSDITHDEIKKLEEVIKGELSKFTHGKNCNIQHIKFDDKDHLFVIAEDSPTTISLWSGNTTDDMLIHPAFDLAFVYDRYEGTLDICCAKGGKPFRNKMQLLFSESILGKEIEELKEDDETYDRQTILQQLIENKKVDFCTNTSKNVHDIFIRSIRLTGTCLRNGNITLDTSLNSRCNDKQDDIYSEIEDYIKVNEASCNTVDINDLELVWLECRVVYYDELTKDIARKKFNISGRSGCNLGFDGIDKEIRECLKAAKIQLSRQEDAKQQAA